MPESAEARRGQRVIRASVREACETWRVQAQAGPVTTKALEAILNRAAVPILNPRKPWWRWLPSGTHHAVGGPRNAGGIVAPPTTVSVMLAAFVEEVAEERGVSSR